MAKRTPPLTWILLGALWAILTANWIFAVGRFQVNVPVWDQWDFMNPLFKEQGWWALFDYQHGPHRQGPAFVISSWVLAASHWDMRVQSLWIASLLPLAALLALRLKWRLTGELRSSDAWILLTVLTIGQIESVTFTPNASHSVFPLLVLLAAANLWLNPRPGVRYPLAGLAAVCLIFSGFGIFGGALLTVLLLGAAIRAAMGGRWREAKLASICLAFAGVGWIVFSFGYRFEPAVVGFRFPWDPLSDYARFIALMLAHPAGTEMAAVDSYPIYYLFGGLLTLLSVTVAGAIGWRWIASREEPLEAGVLLMLIGTGLVYAANTAVGRIPCGPAFGMQSRYITLLVPLWLAIGCYALSRPRGMRVALLAVVWVIALLPYLYLIHRPVSQWPGSLGMTDFLLHSMEEETAKKGAWVSVCLKTGDWEEAQAEVGPVIYPYPENTNLSEKLSYLRDHKLSFYSSDDPAHYLPWLFPARSMKVLSGLYGWEEPGPFAWMTETAILEVSATHNSYLNVRIDGRAPGLPDGPLSLTVDDQHVDVSLDQGRCSFSLPLLARSDPYHIELRSVAGARRPIDASQQSTDTRSLALRLVRLSVDSKAAFPRLQVP